MSRQRSPSYPAISIDQAIDFVARIHSSCRANVIDRETAAREMGYSGLTGRSMKVLADLIQFNLLAKEGKGNVKVTQLGVDVLHGIDPADREQARLEAALAPQLFKDIHDRFPDGIPSENAIKSFLIQLDFQDAAINPAITAFMETYRAIGDLQEPSSINSDATEDQEVGVVADSGRELTVLPQASTIEVSSTNARSSVDGERVVFSEEVSSESYIKLIAHGEMNEDLLDSLSDFVERQRKRLQRMAL